MSNWRSIYEVLTGFDLYTDQDYGWRHERSSYPLLLWHVCRQSYDLVLNEDAMENLHRKHRDIFFDLADYFLSARVSNVP